MREVVNSIPDRVTGMVSSSEHAFPLLLAVRTPRAEYYALCLFGGVCAFRQEVLQAKIVMKKQSKNESVWKHVSSTCITGVDVTSPANELLKKGYERFEIRRARWKNPKVEKMSKDIWKCMVKFKSI